MRVIQHDGQRNATILDRPVPFPRIAYSASGLVAISGTGQQI
jgi:hypothetical protein